MRVARREQLRLTQRDDSIYEGSETAIIAITGVSGGSATENGAQSQTITITDSLSAPTVTLSTSASSVAENGSDLTLTATLNRQTFEDVTVTLTGTGTSTAGTDYASLSTITISAGSTTGTTTFNPTDDSIYEGSETAIIAITGVSGGDATENATQSETITITESQSAPIFSYTISNDAVISEDGSNLTITASLSKATYEDVVLTIEQLSGTATAGVDYASLSTITISAGNTTGTISFNPVNDDTYEGNETAVVNITSVSGGGVPMIERSRQVINIYESLSPPTVSLSTSSSSVAENGSDISIIATLSHKSTSNVIIYFGKSGSAIEGTHYETLAGCNCITIGGGDLTGSLPFDPIDNNILAGNKSAVISISSTSGTAPGASGSVSIDIIDDEGTPAVTLSSNASSVAENGTDLILTATLSIATSEDVTVTLAGTGTSTSGADYASLSTITISAGNTTGTTTFNPTDDNLYELNETAVISISNVSGGSAVEDGSQSLTVTITDNDTAPSLSINDVTASDENAANHTFTVSLSAASGISTTVDYATSDGTATAGADYTAISATTLTFAAGQTSKTFTVGVLTDSLDEADETVTLTLSNASNASISDATGTLTITDDDAAPSLSINDVTASNENAANHTFTVSLSAASGKSVTVDYATSDGTATAGADYTAISATTLTFAAGQTSKTFTVGVLTDSLDEADETVTLTLSNASNASISDATGTLTITDDDAAPSLSINDVTASNENAANHTFTVSLSAASAKSVTVDYATSDGTATAGADYTAISATTLTFAAGQTSKTFTVGVLTDSLDEADETVTLTLSNASNASISDATGTLTITDDDAAPSLSINDVTASNENAANHTFTVSLSAASGKSVTVDYATSDGTATAGADYTAISATTLTFAAGQTSKTFTVGVLTDSLDEADETVTLTLSNASNASISDATGTLTITDDDAAPSLSINDVTASNENAANHTFTVSLSAASAKSVTVDYATSDGTATAGADYTAISATTLTFAAGQTSKTFTVGVLTDSLDEADETVTLTLSNASNASISDATGTLTITDDDAAPSLSINDVSVAEVYNANTTATFTVSLSAASGKTVTVNYATSDGTATAGADYTAISATTLTFAAGQTSKTFNVTILNDLSYESSESATVTLSSAGNASLSDATGILTITDKALNSGNAPLTSSQEITANTTKASTEFTDIGYNPWGNAYSSYYSSTNSFELINLHKAWAYGLTGAGTTVIVSDGEFDSDSLAFNSAADKITISGSITECSNAALTCHGAATAGIIAADIGDSGSVGVAPNAKLILTNNDIVSTTTALNSASSSTVAINNSWGINDSLIDEDIALKVSNSWSSSELVAHKFFNNTGSVYATAVTNWVNAMDNFQDHGVIVFSNSNTSSNDNAEITAALPEIFPELAEAFIAAVNIDVGGSTSGGVAGPSGYRRWSAPCGDAAKYCLAADGTVINLLNSGNRWSFGLYDTDGNNANGPEQLLLGTSFVAPMISGAVALIAEAFPNQDPEDWVDRLLASADNSIGYTHIGYVEFGNGVKHGYSHDAGHGILDIYAALQPITSNSYSQMMHYGASLESQGQSYALNQTQMVAMQSIGDSLAEALEGEVTYFYDALDGGFAFDMGQTIRPSLSVVKPSISIDHEIGETKSLKYKKLSFTNSFSENKNRSGYLTFTESEANSTLIGFASNGSWNGYNDASYVFPFLSDIQGGTGINFGNDLGNGYLTLSYNIEGQDGQNAISAKDALTFGYKASPIENVNISYLLGFADENESFLGVKGTGAFDFDGADNKTTFFGLKSDIKLSNKQFVNFGFGLSDTVINKNNEGIIQSMSGLTANSFEIGFTTFDTFGSDMLSISISQPSRVSSGSAELKIAGLANRDGTIPYTYKNVSMEPSGRQLDFAITYNYELNDFSSLRMKMMMTDEKGHDADVDREESVFIGYSRSSLSGNQKFEIGATSNSSKESALKINYNLNW